MSAAPPDQTSSSTPARVTRPYGVIDGDFPDTGLVEGFLTYLGQFGDALTMLRRRLSLEWTEVEATLANAFQIPCKGDLNSLMRDTITEVDASIRKLDSPLLLSASHIAGQSVLPDREDSSEEAKADRILYPHTAYFGSPRNVAVSISLPRALSDAKTKLSVERLRLDYLYDDDLDFTNKPKPNSNLPALINAHAECHSHLADMLVRYSCQRSKSTLDGEIVYPSSLRDEVLKDSGTLWRLYNTLSKEWKKYLTELPIRIDHARRT